MADPDHPSDGSLHTIEPMLAPSWQMLEQSIAASAMADLDGRLVYVNPAFLSMWRYASSEQVIGQPAEGVFWTDSAAAAAAKAAVRESGVWTGELVARRADGSTMPVWCSAHLVLGTDQQPTGLMASFSDRSAEIEAHRALDAERRFVEAVIGAAGVLVLVLDAHGRFVRFNRECERVSGWPAEEIIGRHPWDTVLPPEQAAQIRAEVFEAALASAEPGATTHYTNAWVARDGAHRLIEWTNRVLQDPARGERFLVSIGVDVTGRHAAEQALQVSEARLRQAQQVARMGSWTLDVERGEMHWSDEVFRLLELDPQRAEPSYETFLATLHPDDRAAVGAAYAGSLANRQPYAIEHRVLMADGRVKWLEERGETEFDADGRPVRSLGTVQDVTERREAQAAMAAREAQLMATLDAFPGFVAAVDDDLRYLYVNERMVRQLGLPREAIVGQPMEVLFGPAQAGVMRGVNARLLQGEEVALERRIPVVGGEERIFSIDYRVQPDLRQPGRHVFFAFATDVTELRQEQRRLSAIIEGTRTGTWEWAPLTGALKANLRLAALLGRPIEVLAERPQEWIEGAVYAEDRAERRRHFERLSLPETDRIENEYRVRGADGGWVWVLERGHVVERTEDGRPSLVLGTSQDITALKRSQEALQRSADELERRVQLRTRELAQATEMAEQASAAKTDFLSNMSHELRTPLNAIIGFGQLLEIAPLPEGERGHVREILRAGEHLLELINEMLDLSTVEAGKVRFQPAAVEIAPLVDECLALIDPAVRQAGLTLDVQVTGERCTAWVDAGRVRQVLLNLLSNAVKYNRRGGRVTVRARTTAAGECELRVDDTGPGLTPQDIERLFRPFERLGSAQQAIQGTGIGLSLCKRLVELMGGRIGVDSRPGQGSSFWVVLPGAPWAEPPPPVVPARAVEARVLPEGRPPMDVLYVEDNPANLRLMVELLGLRPGVRLHTAGDADRGLALAQAVRPALMLLDIQLPGADGFDLLRQLRATGVVAPAVAVTANAMPADVARGEAAGFEHYLTKPLDLRRVLAIVDAALAAHDGRTAAD